MRLAISNIAWDTPEDVIVANLLKHYAIDAIDIAPGKYFSEPRKATDKQINCVKNWWAEHGIEITGMQSLLFGTSGLNMFGSPTAQENMLSHLEAICRIGASLGATRLVFGSPKNRDRGILNETETREIATNFFQKWGELAQSYDVIICLEPNPACYGANFMLTSIETAKIVSEVAHPAIKMQLDTGAITINGEDPDTVLKQYAALIGHIHASEPNLLPLGKGHTNHAAMANSIHRYLPQHIVSIEMIREKDMDPIKAIEQALEIAVHHYRPGEKNK